MKTIQDYINRYYKVANNLGYTGQSIEVLVQLLAQASYISEIENATYMTEASLEKCTLVNSKIQHCVDNMYSVFRGLCPRVVMKIKPTKYLTLKPYEKIIDSQNFSVYYLGYYQVKDKDGNIIRGEKKKIENTEENKNIIDSVNKKEEIIKPEEIIPNESIDELLKDPDNTGFWNYSTATFYPPIDKDDKKDLQIIIGFISPKKRLDNLTISKIINETNTYYVECTGNNLSNDLVVTINDKVEETTRNFSEHILDHKIFDLTLPGFGSRLYLANLYRDTIGRDSNSIEGITENTKIEAKYFEYSKLSDYNESELKKLQFKGAELVSFGEYFLKREGLEEIDKGLCYRKEISRDTLATIHYKSNRDRFVNSIIRSNSDIGTVLEESFPDIIESGGTSYLFTTSNSVKKDSNIKLFYIPKDNNILISEESIEKFKKEKRAYYIITSTINIEPGEKYIAYFNIDLDLYRNSSENDFNKEIGESILINNFAKKFGIVFNEDKIKEIESLISKIPNIKRINNFSINYSNSSGKNLIPDPEKSNRYYFEIRYSITTKVTITE